MLYSVRYEIAVSEMMDFNMDKLEEYVVAEMMKEDPGFTGQINVQDANVALKRCKWLNVTPFQIHVLLGLSECDFEGYFNYRDFAPICKNFIDEGFKYDQALKKQELFNVNKASVTTTHQAARELDKFELFRLFKQFDRNANGTLDFAEYTECLRNCPELGLSPQEQITTALAADLNGDGQIDFEEFMKHFTNILDTIHFNRQLYKLLTDHTRAMS